MTCRLFFILRLVTVSIFLASTLHAAFYRGKSQTCRQLSAVWVCWSCYACSYVCATVVIMTFHPALFCSRQFTSHIALSVRVDRIDCCCREPYKAKTCKNHWFWKELSTHHSVSLISRFSVKLLFKFNFVTQCPLAYPCDRQHVLIPAGQRGPGRRGPVCVSCGSLLCAHQMQHKEVWRESCDTDNTDCPLQVTTILSCVALPIFFCFNWVHAHACVLLFSDISPCEACDLGVTNNVTIKEWHNITPQINMSCIFQYKS